MGQGQEVHARRLLQQSMAAVCFCGYFQFDILLTNTTLQNLGDRSVALKRFHWRFPMGKAEILNISAYSREIYFFIFYD